MKKKVSAFILTGGSGVRVAATSRNKLPKQFIKIAGKPVFIHCIEIYLGLKEVDRIYLVINQKYEKKYDALLKKYRIPGKVIKVPGGATRLFSVMNAMDRIPDESGLVILQSGDCATTPRDVIKKCIKLARGKKAVSAYIPAFYTTFLYKKNILKRPLERNEIGYTCDPQVYDVPVLRKALEYARKRGIKDKPTVELVTAIKRHVFLVESPKDNMKITTESDIKAVESILKKSGDGG